MRLKILTLQGFKTFPERVALHFHQGVTAIVGPNGSGKSNICDAVRWVLGEQSSKALRVKSMEDVIFGGAEFRRPQSFAFVELTLDNTDRTLPLEHDEVTVGRRLYRSGESEYLINQKTVRLKDIHELFMDTGLGRDGYSIIGQGRISEIISAKSGDRRVIFEEAAGIAKFRYRREEAERQLSSAEDNLVRIRDIEQELGERVEPLRIQSEKAKEFLRLSQQRKQLDVSLSVYKYTELQKVLRELDQNLCLVKSRISQLETSDAEAEAEIADCFEKMQQLSAQIDLTRRQVHDNEASIAGSSSNIAVFQNEIQHARDTLVQSAADLDVNRRRCAEVQTDLDKLEQDKSALTEKIGTLAEQISDLEALIADNNARLLEYFTLQNELNQQLQDMASAIGEQNYTLARMEARQGETARRISDEEEHIEQREFDLEDCTRRLERQKTALEALQRQMQSAQDKITAAQQRVFDCQKQVETETMTLHELEQRMNSAKQRIQILTDLERSMDGFFGSVRQIVLAGKNGRLSGIRGTVSDLIQVEQPYTAAIEIALGGSLQHIVVETEQDAKNSIAYLKRGGYGRATFLPLDTIRSESIRLRELEGVNGYLGVAVDLVRFDPQYRNVLCSVLGRVLVAEDLNAASDISARTGRKYRVVTRDGQVINAGGSYTGGSLGKNTGILSRKGEIQRWQTECNGLQIRLSERNTALEQARAAFVQAETNLKPRLNALEELRREQVRQSVELDNRTKQQDALAADIADHRTELDALRAEQKNFDREHKALTDKIEVMEAEQLAVFERIGQENANTAELRTDNESRLHDKNTCALQKVALEKDAEQCAQTIADRQSRLLELNNEIQKLLALRAKTEQSITEWEDKIRSTAALADELTEDNRRQDASIAALAEERDRLDQVINRKRSEQRAQTGDRERLAAESARLSERMRTGTDEQDKLLSGLWENYELSRQQALELADPITAPAQHTAELNRCRAQIKALGQVNVGAIDEYEQVRLRYEFLQAQISDVERSRAQLSSIITELEKNMKLQFVQAFHTIAQEFTALFSQFFEGGRAILELSDPDDLLNSGIEISVQPPGKIVKNLAALSGGEQSFIAICLYFAIQRVRPSPFCLLDEVESALDDINVSKVARYLRTVKETQVIAITHRRGTMEQSDILYGVTTQQDGVSRILTLDLSSAVAVSGK